MTLRNIPIWFLRTVWVAGIIAFLLISIMPIGRTPLSAIDMGDKIAHFGVFFILSLFPTATEAASRKTVFLVLLLVALGSEVIQVFVPYRSGEVMDFIADMLGFFAGSGVGFVLRRCLFH
ncbi:MAG: VanZ family protein [Thermovirgaceae bacterium]|nr:VanZ family protein [Thermovirgaceae bacterium]